MDKTVDLTIPVEPEAAAALADARNRKATGRLVSRVLRPGSGPTPLARANADMKADGRAADLTDAEIDAELVSYNAEWCAAAPPIDRLRRRFLARAEIGGWLEAH